jgi:hypothetical protein
VLCNPGSPMPTPFRFEHTFRASDPAAVLAAYFAPALVDDLDRALAVVERVVLELVDDGATVRRVSRITPQRQLPAVLRPFASAPLHYIETATWRRADQAIDIEIRFPTLRKTPTVRAVYRLSRLSDGSYQRSYEGAVSVDIALLSSRIERGIVAEFERSMPITAACTQAFLDRPVTQAHSGA